MTEEANGPAEDAGSEERPQADGGGEVAQNRTAGETGGGGRRSVSGLLLVDHTPPPVTIESASIIIETDENFVNRDNQGGQGHTRRHQLSPGRSVQGLRILDDAGNTVYLDGDAAGSSVKVWWNKAAAIEQVLVDGATLSIAADIDLGVAARVNHPPGNNPFRRQYQFTHPSAGMHGIEKVEVVKNTLTVFSRELDPNKSVNVQKVMIWDTTS